ncbi:hypothetical protein GCM10010297_48110 [Streptomyces malachitofuscus]|nr:hypothetical protein GCM10010297_48110 [Streptomyces malachitofuscus]
MDEQQTHGGPRHGGGLVGPDTEACPLRNPADPAPYAPFARLGASSGTQEWSCGAAYRSRGEPGPARAPGTARTAPGCRTGRTGPPALAGCGGLGVSWMTRTRSDSAWETVS